MVVTLREILCGSLSLDDGLSAIQNAAITRSEEPDIVFEIARAIEEILLRRPTIANAKLTELTVRLSFRKDRTIPEMIMLFDTRFTCSHRRAETEFLADMDAIPQLLDILGELSQAINSALKLNLRPLLQFLAEETLTTLNSIVDRGHKGSIDLALHEIHYLADILIDTGFFEGAELLFERVLSIAQEMDMVDFVFEVSLGYASVLTELRRYEQARSLLKRLESELSPNQNTRMAALKLLLAINETRDDDAPFQTARDYSDEAINLHEKAVMAGSLRLEDLGLAHLVIGSCILYNGWREAVPQAVERLTSGLRVIEGINDPSLETSLHLVKCLSGLGFAHGLMADHDSITLSLEYLERAESILNTLSENGQTYEFEISCVENAIGWICLSSDSNEHWSRGCEGFDRAISIRKNLLEQGSISPLALFGSQLGLALSKLRMNRSSDDAVYNEIRNTIAQYIPLFHTDERAFVDVAIAIYDVVWLTYRHNEKITPRLLRLLEDVDTMLMDARVEDESGFIDSVSLVVPYMSSSWSTLYNRSDRIAKSKTTLSDISALLRGLATSKLNVDSSSLEAGIRVIPPVDTAARGIDPLLAQYWEGQTKLAETVKNFYENKNYPELAEGLYRSSQMLTKVSDISTDFMESVEFIQATVMSLSSVLFRFARALKEFYDIDFSELPGDERILSDDDDRYDFILSEDWLNLMKITESYLQMVEQSETIQAQPYLNAVFSNISRALRMMDRISMVDRRVLARLGVEMNRRYYLRA